MNEAVLAGLWVGVRVRRGRKEAVLRHSGWCQSAAGVNEAVLAGASGWCQSAAGVNEAVLALALRVGVELSPPCGRRCRTTRAPSRPARPTVVGRAGSEIRAEQDGRVAAEEGVPATGRQWPADGTSACACYRETVAGGRHNGVCLRDRATLAPADGTTACACYRETLAGGRHNGVCLLHGDSGSRTARGSVPATIVLRRAFISRGRHNPFIPPGR